MSYCIRTPFIISNTLILAPKSRKKKQDKFLKIYALQPEFRLGSLYDRRTDQILPSLTLWKEESFEKEGFINNRKSSQQDWFVDSHNTFSSKAENLGIEDGLMLSVMSRMVEPKGHAQYLIDTSSSRKVAKVSLTYKETTVHRELTSNAVHDIDFKEPLENYDDSFTHVVTGIQYGGRFTMVFQRNVKETEKKEEIEESLCAILEEFHQYRFSVSVKGKYEEILNDTDNFRCKVYSDIRINTRVTNWDEALQLYKVLSSKHTRSGNTDTKEDVPVNICLLPKSHFGRKHDALSKELDGNIVNQSKKVIKSLTNAINESHDSLNETRQFPILNEKIKSFLESVKEYKTYFEKYILSDLLQSIRSCSDDEKLLLDAVKQHNQSVFGSLDKWLKKQKQIVEKLLVIYNQVLGDFIPFSKEPSIQYSRKEINIVLLLKVCKSPDNFTDEMVKYYNILTEDETVVTTIKILEEERWIKDESFIIHLQQMADQIKHFASANITNKDINFSVSVKEYDEKPEASIEVWQKGKRLDLGKPFEPPTEIQDLQVANYSHNAIEIKWNIPEEGASNISNYLIEVSLLKTENETENWEFVNDFKTLSKLDDKLVSYKVTSLVPGNTYKISVRCLSLKDIAFSEPKHLTQRTSALCPVANLKATLYKKRQVMLSWEYDKGKEKLKRFLIEYKTSQDLSWQRKSEDAGSRMCTLLDLRFGTCYNFRVQNCHDGEEDTLILEEVNQATEPMGKIQIQKVN